MNDVSALESAGLTKNEAKIYFILLQLKKANVTIISKKTGIHRRSVYDVLTRLVEKGLISYILEDSVRLYQSNDPSKLLDFIEEKKKSLEESLPNLQELFDKKAEDKSTFFFMGKKGIKTVLDNQIKVKKEILILGGSPIAQDIIMGYYTKYNALRSHHKIPIKIIYSSPISKDSLKIDKLPFCHTKSMPSGFGGNVAINIYGENVAIIMWNLSNPFAILIKEKEVADSFRDYFNFIWSKL
jgi:sugar-specific transcriptional regulator TrmB